MYDCLRLSIHIPNCLFCLSFLAIFESVSCFRLFALSRLETFLCLYSIFCASSLYHLNHCFANLFSYKIKRELSIFAFIMPAVSSSILTSFYTIVDKFKSASNHSLSMILLFVVSS